jgi:hypothetical protein
MRHEAIGNSQKVKVIGVALNAMLFALCLPAEAQQPKKIYRIGYLSSVEPAADSPIAEAIRKSLRELDYIEGQNIAIEYRYGAGRRDQYTELAESWYV